MNVFFYVFNKCTFLQMFVLKFLGVRFHGTDMWLKITSYSLGGKQKNLQNPKDKSCKFVQRLIRATVGFKKKKNGAKAGG